MQPLKLSLKRALSNNHYLDRGLLLSVLLINAPSIFLGGLSSIVSQPSQDSGAGATPTKLSNLMHQKQLSQRKKGKKLVRNYIPIQTSICFPLYKKSILCLYSSLAVAHACQPYLQVGICDVSYLDASWRGDLLETKTSLILKNAA